MNELSLCTHLNMKCEVAYVNSIMSLVLCRNVTLQTAFFLVYLFCATKLLAVFIYLAFLSDYNCSHHCIICLLCLFFCQKVVLSYFN